MNFVYVIIAAIVGIILAALATFPVTMFKGFSAVMGNEYTNDRDTYGGSNPYM